MHVSSETVNTHFNIHAQLLNFADFTRLVCFATVPTYKCVCLLSVQCDGSGPGPERPWWGSSLSHRRWQCLLQSDWPPTPHYELRGWSRRHARLDWSIPSASKEWRELVIKVNLASILFSYMYILPKQCIPQWHNLSPCSVLHWLTKCPWIK